MENLKVVQFDKNNLTRVKRTRIALYTVVFMYSVLNFVTFYYAGRYTANALQAEFILSFIIGCLCSKLGRSYSKVILAFIAYSSYVLLAELAFGSATDAQFFFEFFVFNSLLVLLLYKT